MRDRDPLDHVAVRRAQRDDVHVEREQEELAVAVGQPAIGDDAEVLEEAAGTGLELPHDLPGRPVDAEDVVVVRGHVELSVDGDRIGLRSDLDARIELPEVDRVGAPELGRVRAARSP